MSKEEDFGHIAPGGNGNIGNGGTFYLNDPWGDQLINKEIVRS
jgi:hypothetical protein